MNRIVITLVAAAALAGCNKENNTAGTGPDVNNVAASSPIVLPPSIAASKTYRCGDNSVVFVDWLTDNKTANVRTEATGSPTQVVAVEPGKPLTGSGISLTGSASGSSVTLERPGHGSQTCNV
jgi:predicted small secreted protein